MKFKTPTTRIKNLLAILAPHKMRLATIVVEINQNFSLRDTHNLASGKLYGDTVYINFLKQNGGFASGLISTPTKRRLEALIELLPTNFPAEKMKMSVPELVEKFEAALSGEVTPVDEHESELQSIVAATKIPVAFLACLTGLNAQRLHNILKTDHRARATDDELSKVKLALLTLADDIKRAVENPEPLTAVAEASATHPGEIRQGLLVLQQAQAA